MCVAVRPIVPPLTVDLSGSGSGSASGDHDSTSGYMSGSGIPSGSISGSGESGDGSGLVRHQEGADTLMWQTSASGSTLEAIGGSGSGSGVIITSGIGSGDQGSGEESGLFKEQSGASGLPSGLGSGISGSGTSGFFSGGESSGSGFFDVSFIDSKMIDLTASHSGEQELTDVSGSGSAIDFGSASGFGSGSGSASGFGFGSASETSSFITSGHPSGEVSIHNQKHDEEIVILTDNEVIELPFTSTFGPEQGRGSVEISGEGSSQEHYAEDTSVSNSTLYEDYWNANETDDLLPERDEQINVTTQVFDVSDQSPLNTTPPTTSVLTTSPSALLQMPKAMEEPSVIDGNN